MAHDSRFERFAISRAIKNSRGKTERIAIPAIQDLSNMGSSLMCR